MKGKSSVTLKDSSYLKCNGFSFKKNKTTECGILIHQTKSEEGPFDSSSKFNCSTSTIEILDSSNAYTTAPVFLISNSKAKINLEECSFNYGSNIFLKIKGSHEFEHSGPFNMTNLEEQFGEIKKKLNSI